MFGRFIFQGKEARLCAPVSGSGHGVDGGSDKESAAQTPISPASRSKRAARKLTDQTGQ